MMTISRANSMHFVKIDGLLPNVENTLSGNERYGSFMMRTYCQRWNTGDVVTVQVVSDSDTVPTVNVNPLSGAALSDITATLEKSYPATSVLAARYYFEFDVDFASYVASKIQIKVTQGTDIWQSEIQQVEDLSDELEEGSMVLIQYTNKDAVSVLPNVQVDYTTGIEFFLYVEAILKDISYQVEDNMFTNISEKVLIESQTFKARKLATVPLPEFMTDKIAIAGKCFTFLVNDIKYTTDGVPEIGSPGSNLRALTWSLIHTDILGFTTDDKSINLPTMDGILVRYNNAIVNTWTFTVPSGYLFHTVVAGHGVGSAGDYDLKMGYTLHGVDVIDTATIPLSGSNIGMGIHTEPVFEVETTVYVEISGAGAVAKIYVQFLKNTPSVSVV